MAQKAPKPTSSSRMTRPCCFPHELLTIAKNATPPHLKHGSLAFGDASYSPDSGQLQLPSPITFASYFHCSSTQHGPCSSCLHLQLIFFLFPMQTEKLTTLSSNCSMPAGSGMKDLSSSPINSNKSKEGRGPFSVEGLVVAKENKR